MVDYRGALLCVLGVGQCQERQCGARQVSRNGECVNMDEPGLCPEGERIFFDMFGLERCGCEEGRGRINSTCHSLHYRGECGEGEVVMDAEDAAMV